MADLKLNTSTSIVDFLKSQNKPSDYSSRSSLYSAAGLSDRLGSYVGSASQNAALLKNLSTPTSTGAVTPPAPTTPPPATPAPTEPTPTEQPIGSSGITASQATASIPQIPSAEEILNSVLSSSGFQNYQQGQQLSTNLAQANAEATKSNLDLQNIVATKSFVDNMGRRGLFFSGETNTGLNNLATELASSKLNIDRNLATQLLQSDLNTKNAILSQVGDVIKEAQQGQRDALSALQAAGLTVVGNQVVPTLAAQTAAANQANILADNARQEAAAQLSAQRLDTSITDIGGRRVLINTQTGEVVRDLGATPVSASASQVATMGTNAQQTLSTYASRIAQSNPTLTNLQGDILSMSPANFALQQNLPSALQSSTMQQYAQASRNFINAVLRRESGAVISPTEFTEAYAQYLPVPGDGPAVLAQKAQNRQIVQQTFINGAGPAYQSVDQLLGTSAPNLSTQNITKETSNYQFAPSIQAKTEPSLGQKILNFFGL